MKIYRTGLVGALSTVMSILVFFHIRSNFNVEHPTVFYTSHLIFIILFVFLIIKTIIDICDKKNKTFSLLDIVRTLIISFIMYYLAIKFSAKYIFACIVILGTIEVFVTRYKSGLVKKM